MNARALHAYCSVLLLMSDYRAATCRLEVSEEIIKEFHQNLLLLGATPRDAIGGLGACVDLQ